MVSEITAILSHGQLVDLVRNNISVPMHYEITTIEFVLPSIQNQETYNDSEIQANIQLRQA